LKDELWRLRFQLATQQLENPMRIREVRKAFARTMTIIREREIARERQNRQDALRTGDVQVSQG
jgi:large subunit ribosomal protein L29